MESEDESPPEERERPSALPLLRFSSSLFAIVRSPLIRDLTVPRLLDGTELLGPYQGSGLRQVPYLIRSADGHVVQVTYLLYLLAANIDGRRDHAALARRMSAQLGRPVSAQNVEYLVARKLRPLGIVAGGGRCWPNPVATPFAPFRLRRAVVPARLVSALARTLQPLFWPPVVVAVVAALAGFDLWLMLHHGIAGGIRQILLEPLVFITVAGLVVASGAFHELGHATACRYSGARPGRLGIGLYVAWPVFYSDVTDSYRLGRAGRLRTDLGGVYFNVVFGVGAAGVYLVTGIEALTLFVVIQQVQIAHQFMPFLRLDGYHVVADLAGVPEPFARVRPVLASLVPGRRWAPQAAELTGWARRVIAVWALSAVPLVAVNVALLALHGPALVETVGRSVPALGSLAISAVARGEGVAALAAVLRMGMLLLPVVGLVALLASLYRAVRSRARRRRPRLTAAPGPAGVRLLPELLEVTTGAPRPVLYAPWLRPGAPPRSD